LYLAGGGSMLRGLDKRISQKTDLPFILLRIIGVVRNRYGIKNLNKFKTILAK
jgi:actin-like ATPase involved in cell morphogenesis